jgi:copper transport protein
VTLLAAVAFGAAALGAVLERAGVPGSTRFAHAMTVAAVAAAGGAILAAVDLRRVLLLPALVLLAAPAVGGHALDDGVPRIQVLVDFLHLAGAAAWTGGLAALALTIGSAQRFSRLALPAVVLIAITGVLRAISELTSVSQLWSTGYGRAILIKSALFAILVGLGYLARSRLLRDPAALRRSVAVELGLLAGLVVAVAFLTALPPGRALAAPHVAAPPTTTGAAPPPPRDALTLAGHTGSNAVAVAVQKKGARLDVTTTVLNNQGNGADGLALTVNGTPAERCGFGCYRASVAPARTLLVRVNGAPVSFALPPMPAPDGRALLDRIGKQFLRTRSARFHEVLSSGPGQTVVSDWRIAAPNSLAYKASDGAAGIIIGGRRWDRQNRGKWVESPQTPVPQPQLPWARAVYDISVLPSAPDLVRVSFVDPATPAWYTVSADRRTSRVRRIEMVAPVHFMQDTYRSYDTPNGIAPPR